MCLFEPSTLVFLKTCSNEFGEIIRKFTGQNGRSLEKEEKVNLILHIDRHEWHVVL